MEDRKSTSGMMLQLAGARILWASRRQSVVAQSTTEAEYIAAADATKEVLWLRKLLGSIGLKQETTLLCVDNQGAIKLSSGEEMHRRTKHIDVRYHLIRDHVLKKDIIVDYVSTDKQLADIMTKGLSREKFNLMRSALSIN